ncbi:sorbin and SH3 domain-containing protein 2-like [Limulus polyphemus]|uniref:Sorbin and SH3 domain-containing protein 2-like n=1 Tax=Limulus polyphemus TaxID=6850 RepID=A0ABM1T2U9_LIMPO|nr:sorbin and SH3 domain-containing protein 2-like [Limulus polyphemus]
MEKEFPLELQTNVKENCGSDWHKPVFRSLHRFGQTNYCFPCVDGYSSEPELNRKVFPNNAQNSLEEQFYDLLSSSSEDDEFKWHRGEEECQKPIKELDMRRQKDNFMSLPLKPLAQYDDLHESSVTLPRKTSEVCGIAHVLFNFTAKTPRELSLNKGDTVYINKKIDKNWYQIEYHGKTGIFPVKYLKVIPLEPQKAIEGRAIVKLNFSAQTSMELSLLKGETVILTGKVDQNWYEGRIGYKKGIVPSAYLEVLCEPKDMNDGSLPPESLGLTSNSKYTITLNGFISPSENTSYERGHINLCSQVEVASMKKKTHVKSSGNPPQEETIHPVKETMQVNTDAEPLLCQAIYSYTPQYKDELQLHEGDTIFVMKKYDDGWYVGISVQTGLFGTFPGNYVAQI